MINNDDCRLKFFFFFSQNARHGERTIRHGNDSWIIIKISMSSICIDDAVILSNLPSHCWARNVWRFFLREGRDVDEKIKFPSSSSRRCVKKWNSYLWRLCIWEIIIIRRSQVVTSGCSFFFSRAPRRQRIAKGVLNFVRMNVRGWIKIYAQSSLATLKNCSSFRDRKGREADVSRKLVRILVTGNVRIIGRWKKCCQFLCK